MQIGERLFDLRQKSGQSLQQVADAVGASKAHVWELEKGRSQNPSFDLVRRLAAHFGVNMDVLTGKDDVPGSDSLQIARINRGLAELSERDRRAVEQMVENLRPEAPSDS